MCGQNTTSSTVWRKIEFPRNEFVYVMIFLIDVFKMNHYLGFCVTMNTWHFHHFTQIFHNFNSHKTCISKRLMNLSIKYQNVDQDIILKRFCNYMSRQFIPKGKLTPWNKIFDNEKLPHNLHISWCTRNKKGNKVIFEHAST